MSEQFLEITRNNQLESLNNDPKTFQMFIQKIENILNQHQSELALSKQETQVLETKTELKLQKLKADINKLKDKLTHIFQVEAINIDQQSSDLTDSNVPKRLSTSTFQQMITQDSINYGDLVLKVEKLERKFKKYSNKVERQSEKQTILQNFIRDKEARKSIVSICQEMCEELVFSQINELKLNIDQKIQAQMSCVDNVTRAMRRLDGLLEQQRNQILIFKDELVNSVKGNIIRVDKVCEQFADVKQSIQLKLQNFEKSVLEQHQKVCEFNELNIPSSLENFRNEHDEQTLCLNEKMEEIKNLINVNESIQNNKLEYIRKELHEKIDLLTNDTTQKIQELKINSKGQNQGTSIASRITKVVKQLQDRPKTQQTKPEDLTIKNSSTKNQDSKSIDSIPTPNIKPKHLFSKPRPIDMAYLNKLGKLMEMMIKLYKEAKDSLEITKLTYKIERQSEGCIPEFTEQQDTDNKQQENLKNFSCNRRKSVRVAHQAHQIRVQEGLINDFDQEFNDKEIIRKLSPVSSQSPKKSINVIGQMKDLSRRSKAQPPARTFRIESINQELSHLIAQSVNSQNPFIFNWNERKNSSVLSEKSHF